MFVWGAPNIFSSETAHWTLTKLHRNDPLFIVNMQQELYMKVYLFGIYSAVWVVSPFIEADWIELEPLNIHNKIEHNEV